MERIKTIGLVAHDARKRDMMEWVRANAKKLSAHKMICTGTTGRLIKEMFDMEHPELPINIELLKPGPLGGDQQTGALIAGGKVDVLIFFTDPMTTQPHDVDVKALMRICSVYDTVIACTKATADFVIASPLFESAYESAKYDYGNYLERELRCD